MGLVADDILNGKFQRAFARPNAGNHFSVRSVKLNDDVSRFLENALGCVRHRLELAAGDPVAPDAERAELPGGAQHQIG